MPYRTLGIDLGTTNSVTAWLDGGVPVVLSNRHKEQATPSAVGVAADGSLRVGSEALGECDRLPGSLVTEVKRLIGRSYTDADVQRIIRERLHGERLVRESPDGGVEIRLGEHYLTPVQISAILLRRLRTDAENTAGEAFRRAVITVPAYFTEPQYAAVREAGELAGFTVARILPEPTAAAHAFGVERPVQDDDDMCSVLVYDLGGGTFDVSLLITGPGYFEVYALDGDKALGGADFDYALYGMLTERLGDRAPSGDNDAGRIRAAAERTKIELSSAPASEVILAPLGKDGGSWTGEVTRADFEELIDPKITRTLELTRSVLRKASRTTEDIDKVLLVGGSTRIPLVRRLLTELFDTADKETVSHETDPMAAVALGAAVEAGLVDALPCPSEPCLTTGIPLTQSACPDCGTSLLGTATVDCPGCHVPAAEGTAHCPVCAADLSGLRAAAPVAARSECPHCGCRENSTSATACQDCDRPLDAGGLKCPQCQMVNAAGLTACSACDALFHTHQPEQVTAQNLGLALNDGTVAVAFPAGTKYPTAWQNIENLQFRPEDATALTFRILEGTHDASHDRNEFCGEHTHHLGAGSGSAERLTFRVRIDENRTVHLKYRIGDGEEVGARLRRNVLADRMGREAAHLLDEIRLHLKHFDGELKAAERDTFAELTEQLTAIVHGEPAGRSLDGFLDEARDMVETCRNARGWAANASVGARRGRELGLDRLAGELGDARSALNSARERMDLPAMRRATETARDLWRKIDAAIRRSMLTAHDAEIGRFPESVRRSVLTAWDELRAAAARRDYAAQDALHVKLNELARHSQAPDPAAREHRGSSAQVFPERR